MYLFIQLFLLIQMTYIEATGSLAPGLLMIPGFGEQAYRYYLASGLKISLKLPLLMTELLDTWRD